MNAPGKLGFLIDLDGVIYRGNQPIFGACEFLTRLQTRGIPFLFLTNNSCFTPHQFQKKLAAIGIKVSMDQFYSSALATASWLADEGAQRVYAIGEDGLFEALADRHIESHSTDVTHVIVGLDRSFNYEKLALAARLISAGARFVATNSDPTIPVEDGLDPGCGAILSALQAVTGQIPFVIGKPRPVIYQGAARRLKIPLNDLTMIGDRLDTDIAGALTAGARAILLLTGQTTREQLATSTISPHEVWDDLTQATV